MRLRIRNFVKFVAGSVAAIAAGGILLLLKPTTADVVAVALDASHSVGVDYRNKYLPTVASMLPELVNKRLRIFRFGGVWEEVFQGTLREEDVNALREWFLRTEILPPHILGSPISSATLEGIKWLSHQEGKRKVLLVFTDGEEQMDKRIAQELRQVRKIDNLTTVFCFPRRANPIAAEVARLTGAQVIVACQPDEVHQAIQKFVFGAMPLAPKLIAFALIAVGIATLLLSLRLERSSVSTEAEPLLETEPSLTPLEVELSVRVANQPLMAFRRLRPGERFIVTRRGVPSANLTLPLKLLGDYFDLGIAIQAEGGLHFCLQNFGRVPCIVNGSIPLRPGESRRVEGKQFEIEIFPTDIRLVVEARPVASDQQVSDRR